MREQCHDGPEEGHEQHQHVGSSEQEQQGGEGGGGVHDQQRGGGGQLENSLTARLKHPEDNISPKWVKSRRRKVQDGLKQAKLQFQPGPAVVKNQNYPSDRGLSCPSGGPWGYQKSERGFKRGLGDQIGGPVRKKKKD